MEKKEIFYVGNPNNLEAEIATKKGYKFLPVVVTGMPRKFGMKLIFWFITLQFAIFKALFYVKKYKPNAIIGTGLAYKSSTAPTSTVLGF